MPKKAYYYRYIGVGESYHTLPARDMSEAAMQGHLSRVSRLEKAAILRLYEKVEGELPTVEKKVVDNRLIIEPVVDEPEPASAVVEPTPAEQAQ